MVISENWGYDMSFYPDVSPGDPFKPNARLSNDIRHLVNAAHAITDNTDARYEAFAKAEAYFLEHALCLPTYYNKGIQLTQVNDFVKINSLYGNQSERYVNWEVSDTVYTADEYAGLK